MIQILSSLPVRALAVSAVLAMTACSGTYYSALEGVGIHKRDVMVERVEDARDSQEDAQQQFQSALEQFGSVVALEETDLKKAYDQLNSEYQDSVKAAEEVSSSIDDVESVAEALFDEWDDELDEYDNKELRDASRKQLKTTRTQYDTMLTSMREAGSTMEPVLTVFRDNVLFLKHNLNAQAIGSLEGEFASLKLDIESLIAKMNESIEQSNAFIANMGGAS